MKKLLVLSAFLMSSVIGFSQTQKEDLDIIKAEFNKDKKMLVQDYMSLEGPQADAFWKVYYEYEAKRNELSTERLKIIDEYAGSYNTLTDDQAIKLAERALSNEQSFISLRKSYLKKFAKAAGPKNAVKFIQLDTYLQTVIRKEVMDNIPFIDELD